MAVVAVLRFLKPEVVYHSRGLRYRIEILHEVDCHLLTQMPSLNLYRK